MKAFGRQNKLLNSYPTVRHLKDEITSSHELLKKQHRGRREFLGSQVLNVRVVNVWLLAVDTHRVLQLDQ